MWHGMSNHHLLQEPEVAFIQKAISTDNIKKLKNAVWGAVFGTPQC
jgi:hypothetical protein